MPLSSAIARSSRFVAGIAALAALASMAIGSASAQVNTAAPQSQRPALLVFVTIDQMRADYFDRFGPELTGGLKRLRDGGAFFPNGFQDHAITETAPGHASTMSGRFPVSTGIAMNSQGVNGVPNAQVLGGREGESASPERFRGTTLIDWLRAAEPQTKWLSVSRKDRGAILPIGKSKGDVYWYYPTGDFTTSRYYATALPEWVQSFNASSQAHAYAGKVWDLRNDPSTYPESDWVGIEGSAAGSDIGFPHRIPEDPMRAAAVLANYPVMDELTLRFALHGVRSLGLGSTPGRTDVLAVSLSTTDAVGHRYGPDSREIHDQILRLDDYLGTFLDSLESVVGVGRLLVALTADHGVMPSPMLKSTIYPNGEAKRVSLDLPWRAFLDRLVRLGIDTNAVAIDEGLVALLKPQAFTAARTNADTLFAELGRDMMRVQGVSRVDLMSSLARADTVNDVIARRWLHMYSSSSNVRLIATLTPYSYWLPVTYPTHGSPYDGDAKVPVLFWGAGVSPGAYSDTVRVVDMAPTLAAILGIKPLEATDGRVLQRVVR
ncbi:MAG: alkaline phosphatase family protein [Gemmatimonadetes bacterium]|nr:alkaline phosphatase family protein [Gemmatimonadota bacterium]